MKEKFNSIDLFKFLMAIVVVAIHTNPFAQCRITFVNEAAMTVEDMAVPFFFVASGYLMAVGWGDTRQQRERYIQKTVVSVIRLYVTWTLLSLPLTLYGYAMSGNSVVSCIFSYVKYFFFVGTLYNSYHLWYLLAMIYALLGMWFLIHRGKGTRHILMTAIFFYILYLSFVGIRRSAGPDGVVAAIGKVFYFVFNEGGVFVGMLYMSIGICIREHCRARPLLCVVGIAVGVLIRYSLSPELGSMLSAAMLFALVLNIKLPDNPCYIILRGLSKYIYLMHLLCFSFYTFIIIGQPNKLGVDSFVATFVLSAVLSGGIIYIKGLLKNRVNSRKTEWRG